jgi:hypothetical protein
MILEKVRNPDGNIVEIIKTMANKKLIISILL